MADELDDVAVPEDLEDDDLELEVVDDADEVIEGLVDDEADLETDTDEEVAVVVASPAAAAGDEGEEEEEEDAEDEDVEASLDVILKERLVIEDEPEDEEVADVDDRTEQVDRVLPKQPDEFVCRSCFLVKHPSQLADKKRMLCRDCV